MSPIHVLGYSNIFISKNGFSIKSISFNSINEPIGNYLLNYKKEIKKISLNINSYIDIKELEKLLIEKAKPGKIFIGTLTPESSKIVKNYCYKGILFFSFAPDKSLADECVYLINFFPEDDLIALFNHFPEGSRIALLFPENAYGYYINYIIDPIADESSSLIVNRASYKEDLTNAREAIKELSKYELRKYELNRQKKILESIICANHVMTGSPREITVASKGRIICPFRISGIENIVYGYREGYAII